MLGQRDLAGRGMHAFASAIQLAPQLVGLRVLPPAAQSAARGRAVAFTETEARVDILEGGARRCDVAAMAIDKVETLEPLALKRQHQILDHRHQGAGTQRDGARESEIELRDTERERRRHQRVGTLAQTVRHRLGGVGIGADQALRPVLFGRADRHHHAA